MQTDTLLLLPLTPEDYPWLCALYADPEIMQYIGTGVRTYEVASAVLNKILAAPPPAGYWTLRDKQSGEPLGGAMLMIRKEGSPLEIGFLLAKQAWGRGLATQAVRALLTHAFTVLKAPLMEAFTHELNAASGKVLLKAGFHDAGLCPGPYGGTDRKFSISREQFIESPH
jgi:RimJ/RimL family protein N-acetyltransferase